MATAVLIKILAIGILICAQRVLAQMGPLNLDILNGDRCDGDNNDIVLMEIISIDENQKGVNGFLNLPWDMDQSISYSVNVDKIEGGQVQKDVFIHSGNYFCEDIEKVLGDMWTKLVQDAGMPDGCPKAMNNYKIDNHPLDYDDIKLEKFLYGRFRMNIHVMRMGAEVACIYFEFTNTKPGEGRR